MSNYEVDREKWARLTIFEQMGNIGSEVGRASIARDKGNQQRCDAAFDRALDLFDATLRGTVFPVAGTTTIFAP